MKKLTLNKETLQVLNTVQADEVQGGRPNTLDTFDTCYCISLFGKSCNC